MKLGLWLPIVHRTPPRVAPAWENEGGIEDIAIVAAAAESHGYEYVCAPEHIAMPVARADTRGEVYWDPISTLGYIAARTQRIRLVPLVFVASYHHPLEIAKRMGTLDLISGGRVIIGMGVGSLAEEFELLGASMKERGKRTDDSLAALKAACGVRVPSYQGQFYRFDGMIVDPGLRADTPIWVGGLAEPSLHRAIKFADGWCPTIMKLRDISTLLARDDIRAALKRRNTPLEVCYVMGGSRELDALGKPNDVRDYLRELHQAGIHTLVPALVNTTRDNYLRQLQAMAELTRDIGKALA